MNFDDAFERLMLLEGGYSNNSADPGAETMFGVTARVAHAEGYIGDMKALPKEVAKSIARRKYWDAVHCDELPEGIRYAMFDSAYNSGPTQAVKWLQRAVSVQDDGVIGPMTIGAANRAASLLPALLGLRLDFLTSLPTFGAFGKGWVRRVASILQGA